MKATKHIVIAEKALENSTTVSTLEIDAAKLWTALQSPPSEAFLEATIMVIKSGGSNNYADLYRILANANSSQPSAPFDSITVQQTFHWDIRVADNPYSGVVSAVTIDTTGTTVRVRLTGSGSASGYTATTWLKAWANG